MIEGVKGKSQPEPITFSQQCVGLRFQRCLHPLLGLKGLGDYVSSKVDIRDLQTSKTQGSINSIGSL